MAAAFSKSEIAIFFRLKNAGSCSRVAPLKQQEQKHHCGSHLASHSLLQDIFYVSHIFLLYWDHIEGVFITPHICYQAAGNGVYDIVPGNWCNMFKMVNLKQRTDGQISRTNHKFDPGSGPHLKNMVPGFYLTASP